MYNENSISRLTTKTVEELVFYGMWNNNKNYIHEDQLNKWFDE